VQPTHFKTQRLCAFIYKFKSASEEKPISSLKPNEERNSKEWVPPT
jgi:hypothetical protein